MMISGLGRSLVIFGALSMLAACGSQSSIDTPGAMPQAHHIRTASSYQVLHSFGGSGDGDNPSAGLVVCCNIEATLYGTTYGGGANCSQGGGCGTVFSVTTSGTESVLYSFKGSGDGSSPDAGLLNVNGTLYGTTYTGGANEDGTVFSVTPSGTETVLYRFKGTPGDGANPIANLIHRKVRKGTLYGTTFFGGAHGDGTVFSVTTSGKQTILHSFGGSGDGSNPQAGLLNVDGTLYGTTYGGGANGDGTVFSVTTSGTETVRHSFGGSGDGGGPIAGLLNVKGKLYGTTADGGANGHGTVFSVTTSGTETVLHSFGGSAGDGDNPGASLIVCCSIKGTLYGTTTNGGTNFDGTVFSVTTSGTETVLHSFGGSGDGAHPDASLLNVNGTLYGTTGGGGAHGDGTVFSLLP